ncbi:alpha/beta hydrolase [Zavarzinia compransoris]|uniref:Alpha/beta hydrolase n=1 Tax=Zavarzinia compransoris TaxID=1264899 RepID=A0A317EA89_9PROT|nr:alpha/beta fold hydrolase [Zavarzinia compransoris]PWR23060.1 alpha/beta hydrolase [Zavarzinia compransoris]TDP46395.1 carboxylesterase [Zavarzinia compransoris]
MTAAPPPPPPRGAGFHFAGGSTAVLLIHGLTGTPGEVKPLARALARDGNSVYGVQLAGHCGTEADLLATDRHDWLDSALDAFDRIRRNHETVFVGGLSMGALLSLMVAAERPGLVAGCLLYSPTMFYDGWSIPRASIFLHLALVLGLGRFVRFRESFPHGIKDERLRAKIVSQMEAGRSADAGLLYMPGLSLRQLLRLISTLKRRLPRIRTPTLLLHAREDDVTSIRNAAYIAANIGGRIEKILLENSYHMITIDQERDLVADHSAAFIRRIGPASRAAVMAG